MDNHSEQQSDKNKKEKITVWEDEPQTLKRRTCSSGVRFGGRYVEKQVEK